MNKEQLVKKLLGYKNELKNALFDHDKALVEFYEEMIALVKQQLRML